MSTAPHAPSTTSPNGTNTRSSLRYRPATTDAPQVLTHPELAILPVLLVVIVIGALLNAAFLSYDNIFGILQQASELAVLVMGLTLVLITGKFDLSLESTFGLAPMVGAFLFLSLDGTALGLLDSPVAPWLRSSWSVRLIGAFNGFLVVYLKFNAFIATLATLILLRGVSLGLTKGETLSGLPKP